VSCAEEAKYKLWLGKGRHGRAPLGLLQAGFISQSSAPPSDLISLAIFSHSEFTVSSSLGFVHEEGCLSGCVEELPAEILERVQGPVAFAALLSGLKQIPLCASQF
jgi:hypothetical protein